MNAPAFIDVRGLAYVDSEHPVSCGSKSRAIGKSGKRRELYPRAIPTLCDCGVRDAARKKREQLHALAPDHALLLRALTSRAATIFALVGSGNARIDLDHGVFVVPLDAAGCPALDEPLREALRRAIGLEAAR